MSSEPSFTLQRLTPTDRNSVQQLWDDRFGGASSTQAKWIDAALDPSRSPVGLVAVSPSEEIVGLSFLEVGSRGYTRQYLGLDVLDLNPPLADQNGIFHLSCVRADWEGRGIGSAFYERRLNILADRDISHTFGIAWHRSHAVDSRVLFEKYDFTQLATVERYYARTNPRPNCPECRDSCTCTASLYTRPATHSHS